MTLFINLNDLGVWIAFKLGCKNNVHVGYCEIFTETVPVSWVTMFL